MDGRVWKDLFFHGVLRYVEHGHGDHGFCEVGMLDFHWSHEVCLAFRSGPDRSGADLEGDGPGPWEG